MKKTELYVQLSRPFTLLPPLLGIVSGSICAWGSVHNPDPARHLSLSVILTVALGSLCASFMNAASNAINQITDLEIDRVNKPGRPLVTGALTLREGWIFTWIFYALALVPTWAVVVFPHTTLAAKIGAPLPWHETFYIYLAGMVFTLIYSVPSWGRTKARGMWANWTIAIPRGCLLKVAGWAMVARIGHWEPWALGSIFMLFLVGAASTKDFADIKGDAAAPAGSTESGAHDSHRQPGRAHGARRSAHRLGLLHGVPDPARSRRPDADGESPQLEADVPDDDGRPGGLRRRLLAAALS